MKKIEKWVTSDGQEFDTRSEAQAHEGSLKATEGLSRFFDELGISARKRTEYERIIADWETYKLTPKTVAEPKTEGVAA